MSLKPCFKQPREPRRPLIAHTKLQSMLMRLFEN
jgi:hypothetical protein